jgi:hypothetical protein
MIAWITGSAVENEAGLSSPKLDPPLNSTLSDAFPVLKYKIALFMPGNPYVLLLLLMVVGLN